MTPYGITNWEKIKHICYTGNVKRKLKVGQFLNVYSPTWGFIDWEIVHLEDEHFYVVAGHPVIYMSYDQPESGLNNPEQTIDRVNHGSNHPFHNAIHKFLNSSSGVGKWWYSSTPFDAKPPQADSIPGFKYDLPEEFLTCVRSTPICHSTSKHDKYCIEKETVKFFIPPEYFLADYTSGSGKPFFNIKYKREVPWWIEPIARFDSHHVKCITKDGDKEVVMADALLGVMPSCRIGFGKNK